MLSQVRAVPVGPVTLGGGRGLVLIAGPCVIESEAHTRRMAELLKRLTADLGIPFIFKASYDKANRSSVSSFRGPGLREGLRVLTLVRKELGVPILSDVHSEIQIPSAAEALDMLQIPAFLCRQTDLLIAAGKTGKPVNIKKGQFLAPWDVKNLVDKVESTGNKNTVITERGASFGYNNLVSDMRSLPVMRGFDVPVIFDATHSVQLPGGQGHASGGDRDMVPFLARAAVATGVDGLFLEVHDHPDAARCDGPNMIALDDLRPMLEMILEIDRAVRKSQ